MRIASSLSSKIAALLLLIAALTCGHNARAEDTTITSPSPLTGLWWNPSESGWGISITQHGSIIFAAWYTYDGSGKSAWYVASSCPLVGNACLGELYRVTGGRALTVPWEGAGVNVEKVGSISLAFTDNNTGALKFTINGASGSKSISRQVFGTSSSGTNYSDLWWNSNESGWGAALTHQGNTIFLTVYTYDASGAPTWFVASACAMAGSGCSGDLYQVTGGSAPNAAWSGGTSVAKVGTVSIAFSTSDAATMTYTINGTTQSKAIARQAFAGTGEPAVQYSDVFDAYFAAAGGGFRHRGIQVTDAAGSTRTGCVVTTTVSRSDIEATVAQRGGRITASTPTLWCGSIGSDSVCLRQFGNVVVYEETDTGYAFSGAYLTGMFSDKFSVVEKDTSDVTPNAYYYARTRDPSMTSPNPCPSEPSIPANAINGNWTGYSFNYSPAAHAGFTALATMSCTNPTCSILGTSSATVSFTQGVPWKTASGVAPLAGATMSSDQTLVSAFICNAPLDESRTFENCTFYTFRRQ